MVYENKQDWPEKYDINKLISRQNDIEKMIKGEKISVRRNDRYADVGDEIVLNDHTFVVEDVYQQQLKELTDKEAQQEGFKNLEEYKDILTSIHDGAVWDPDLFVWAHVFKKK